MQDVLSALITHYLTVSAITDLVSTRVFGGRLPDDQVADMPRKCIVLTYAGGLSQFRTHRLQQPRIDHFSYGEDPLEAGRVDRAVCDALIAISRLDVNDTLLHSAAYSDGPYPGVEPEAGWDFMRRAATIKAGETTTA